MKDEALKLALELFEAGHSTVYGTSQAARVITAIREALAEQPDMNLNCKSVQARLATSWGYVKAEQPAHVAAVNTSSERVAKQAQNVHEQPASKPCEWQREDDIHMPDTWRSECGVLWTFTDGGPVENDMKHCCGCGAMLREKNT